MNRGAPWLAVFDKLLKRSEGCPAGGGWRGYRKWRERRGGVGIGIVREGRTKY